MKGSIKGEPCNTNVQAIIEPVLSDEYQKACFSENIYRGDLPRSLVVEAGNERDS